MELMLKNKNKKAMVFTLLAIALLSLFLASYGFYSISKDRKSVNKRIETMNNYIFSIEENLPRQLFISGFRMIFLSTKEVIDTGDYITNINSTFQELFYNGTINNEQQDLMIGVTFSGITEAINDKAREININVSLTNPNLIIIQDDPWNVKITLKTDIMIMDSSNLAVWNRSLTTSSYIPITSFEDPLYIINSNGLLNKKYNKTIHATFVQGADVSNLLDHTEKTYYINSSLAPSFLDRLEGKISSNVNGIESLVYLPDLSTQGIELKSKSVVDYIYFSNINPVSYQIQGMPSWFRIDDNHLDIYGVENLTV